MNVDPDESRSRVSAASEVELHSPLPRDRSHGGSRFLLRPRDHNRGDLDGLRDIRRPDFFPMAGIAVLDSIGIQQNGIVHAIGDSHTCLNRQLNQCLEVMHSRKVDLPVNQDRLQRLLRGLLSMETRLLGKDIFT